MRILTLALVLLCGGVARGEWLVDGPWVEGGRVSGETTFYGDNSIVDAIGLPFNLDEPRVIDTIMAHVQILATAPAGSHFITTIQRNSTIDLPGEELFAGELTVPRGTHAVQEIAVTGLTLPPGDYWVTIGCPPGSIGGVLLELPGGIPHPYASAYRKLADPTRWVADYSDAIPLIQVSGHGVPEPSGVILAGMATLCMALKRKGHAGRPPCPFCST